MSQLIITLPGGLNFLLDAVIAGSLFWWFLVWATRPIREDQDQEDK